MSFSKDVNVGPCSVQQRPGCRSDVAAAAALRRGICARPELPMGCCDPRGLQDQLPHGLDLPCAAAGLLQQTWARQGGILQRTAKLISLEVGSRQGFGVSFGLVLVPVICRFMTRTPLQMQLFCHLVALKMCP